MKSDALLPAKTLLGVLIMKALGVYAGASIIDHSINLNNLNYSKFLNLVCWM